MSQIANFNDERTELYMGSGSVVIRKFVDGIKGGRTLNCTGITLDTLKAGHVIIRDTVNDTYKPMPLSGSAYDSLPANHEYIGVLVNDIPVSKPFAAIMTAGSVNEVAGPYSVSSIKSALKSAVPTLIFEHD